jgi:hypothetical protein
VHYDERARAEALAEPLPTQESVDEEFVHFRQGPHAQNIFTPWFQRYRLEFLAGKFGR